MVVVGGLRAGQGGALEMCAFEQPSAVTDRGAWKGLSW